MQKRGNIAGGGFDRKRTLKGETLLPPMFELKEDPSSDIFSTINSARRGIKEISKHPTGSHASTSQMNSRSPRRKVKKKFPTVTSTIMSTIKTRSKRVNTRVKLGNFERATVKDTLRYIDLEFSKVKSRDYKMDYVTASVCDLIMTYASCTATHSHILQPLVQVLMGSIYNNLGDYQPSRLGNANIQHLLKRETYMGENQKLLETIATSRQEIVDVIKDTGRLKVKRTHRQNTVRKGIREREKNVMYYCLHIWRRNVRNIRRQRVLLTSTMSHWNHKFADPDYTRKVWVFDFLRYRVCLRKFNEACSKLESRKELNDNQRSNITENMTNLKKLRFRIKKLERELEACYHNHLVLDDQLERSEGQRESMLGMRIDFVTKAFLEITEIFVDQLHSQLAEVMNSPIPDFRRIWYDDPCRIFAFSKEEALEELLQSSEQDVILSWLNFQLRQFRVKKTKGTLPERQAAKTNIGNFTTDLRGGLFLVQILVETLPEPYSTKMYDVLYVHEPYERMKKMLQIVFECKPELSSLVDIKHVLYCKNPIILAAFLARLICVCPSIPHKLNCTGAMEDVTLITPTQTVSKQNISLKYVSTLYPEDIIEDIHAVKKMIEYQKKNNPFYRPQFYKEVKKPKPKPHQNLFVSTNFEMMKSKSSRSQTIRKANLNLKAIKNRYTELLDSSTEIRDPDIKAVIDRWLENAKYQFSKDEHEHTDNISKVELKNCFLAMKPTRKESDDSVEERNHRNSIMSRHSFRKNSFQMGTERRPSVIVGKKSTPRRNMTTVIRQTRRNQLEKLIKSVKAVKKSIKTRVRPSENLDNMDFDFHNWLVSNFASVILQVFEIANDVLEDYFLITRVWRIVEARLECFIMRTLTNRLRGNECTSVDHHALKESRVSVGIIHAPSSEMFKEQKEWDPIVEIAQLEEVLKHRQDEIKNIFLNYAQSDEENQMRSLMNENEMWIFIKDSKISNSKFPKKLISTILTRVFDRIAAAVTIQRWIRAIALSNRVNIAVPVPMKDGKPSTEIPRQLSRRDFIETLITLAYHRQSAPSLAERVNELVEILVQNTRQLEVSAFRSEVHSQGFFVVFETYRWQLRHIFIYFACQTANPEGSDFTDETMNKLEWAEMLRCVRLLEPDGPITMANMSEIFHNAKTEEYDLDYEFNSGGDTLLSYENFLEALVILACFRYSDPYAPLMERFERFLKEDFFPSCFRWINSPAGKHMNRTAELKNSKDKVIARTKKKLAKILSKDYPNTHKTSVPKAKKKAKKPRRKKSVKKRKKRVEESRDEKKVEIEEAENITSGNESPSDSGPPISQAERSFSILSNNEKPLTSTAILEELEEDQY